MKPKQYAKGIDTFERMEANCTKDEILAFCKGNIDKYNWRKKEQDLEDYRKIIDYANFAIKQLSKVEIVWNESDSVVVGKNKNNFEL